MISTRTNAMKMSQKKALGQHMKAYKRINMFDALALYGILRLSARIFDLRKDGWEIHNVPTAIGAKSVVSFRMGPAPKGSLASGRTKRVAKKRS